jgi:hypothetical protein
MNNYRIVIEERNNGQKLYTPQVCKLEIKKRGFFRQTQELVWYNIYKIGAAFGRSTTIGAKYGNEEDALKVIENYKNKHQVEKDNEVKSTTYKMID